MHTVSRVRIEAFFNQNHSPSDGKFASGRGGTYAQRAPRPVAGRFTHMTDSQLARSSNPAHKRELEDRKKSNTAVFLSARVEEFFNQYHDPKDGKFTSGAGKSGQRTKMPTTPHQIMKARESRQSALAQTNRARANMGMPPIQN